MQASKYMVYAIFAYLVIGILFLTTNYHWGYDEFGAVVSHLELDDESFLAVYKDFLYSKVFPRNLNTLMRINITYIFSHS